MILSHTHRYVYIGIPRTGSKSMNHWLCEHFDGQFHGGHHDYTVPDAAAGYLVFTVDPTHLPRFPHHPERGFRPAGTFFDPFAGTDTEAVVWAHAAEDFAAFGYRRFEWGLPEDAPDARWIAR